MVKNESRLFHLGRAYLLWEQLFDDEGVAICDGDEVRVNGEYDGRAHLDGNGRFHIEGWPTNGQIESLEVINRLPVNIDNIHPMIKE